MSKLKNCPNCGAPYESENNKCPYCGTSYYDLSSIDFTEHKPIYLKFKTKIGNQTVYITQLVIPSLNYMESSSDTIDCCGGLNNVKLYTFQTNYTLNTNINFKAVRDQNDRLCTITMEE